MYMDETKGYEVIEKRCFLYDDYGDLYGIDYDKAVKVLSPMGYSVGHIANMIDIEADLCGVDVY